MKLGVIIVISCSSIWGTLAAQGAETLWAESGGALRVGQPCLAWPLTYGMISLWNKYCILDRFHMFGWTLAQNFNADS